MSTELATPPTAPAAHQRRVVPIAGRGEPFVWLTGSGLAVALAMIASLLGLVTWSGLRTFWPRPLVELELLDGQKVLGEVTRAERYTPSAEEAERLAPEARAALERGRGSARRRLLRVGNYDLYGDDFRWVSDLDVRRESRPAEAWAVERLEWGPAFGYPRAVLVDDSPVADAGGSVATGLERLAAEAQSRMVRVHRLERADVGDVNHELERLRLELRKVALAHGEGSPEYQRAAAGATGRQQALEARYQELSGQIAAVRAEDDRYRLRLVDAAGTLLPERPNTPDRPLKLSQVVRAYPANRVSLAGRVGIYLDRWREYLVSEPREANTEGGVFPAIFGTFLMTVLMSLLVAPFGVVAALYLREYARQGALVSAVRIAVNNLAGVPSIVFGVFGLGFFCYALGGSVDRLLYPERLPNPTFGTGGILWASLTLALLTVPVVIVATEEALAAVPRSMREGSYACGASKWQTIRRIVLPSATPGILTGLILAMARGAGEVAPLMLTGVVKLAPELPFDGHFPWFHLERSFMHLGFHIYDVGFQSRNSEAGKPMVFTTTLLLITLVTVLNLAAFRIRARLKAKYRSGQF